MNLQPFDHESDALTNKLSCWTYTSMDITTELIAAAMGKGRGNKCEVVGQDSFASLTSCCQALSHVCAKYCGRPQQHWRHDTCGMAVVSLKCAAAMRTVRIHFSVRFLPCAVTLHPHWFNLWQFTLVTKHETTFFQILVVLLHLKASWACSDLEMDVQWPGLSFAYPSRFLSSFS